MPHQEQQRLALERVFLQNLDPFRVLDVEPSATEEDLQVQSEKFFRHFISVT
jgi:hypothetical protein